MTDLIPVLVCLVCVFTAIHDHESHESSRIDSWNCAVYDGLTYFLHTPYHFTVATSEVILGHPWSRRQTCADKLNNCKAYGISACTQFREWATENCKQFCNICHGAASSVQHTGTCVDKVDNCALLGTNLCTAYVQFSQINCQKTCNMCTTQTTASDCQDKLQNCASYGQSSCVDPYESWAKTNCAKFCNKCSSVGTGAILGHSDVCVYKGQIHRDGETWQDGCDKTCTCVNGKSGYYTCQSKCPVYKNLPPSCTLVAKPGQCCKQPHCPTALGTNLCVYKGRQYKQHETWNDGCSYKCSCEDAVKGFYKCRSRCVQWKLPSQCHLEAPGAGLCCETPSCPPGFKITYPPGYRVE